MKKDPVINVALSQSQIYELLAHTTFNNDTTTTLMEARTILRSVVREVSTNNNLHSNQQKT